MKLDINEIQKIIPHRYPFLFVDKIIELEENKRIVGLKSVSFNESFFQGHFPNHPVMPGVLIIEALAQTAAILMMYKKDFTGKTIYFMSIDNVKFRKPVFPGNLLRLEIDVIRLGIKVCKFSGKAYIGDELATEGEFTAGVVDKND